MDILTDVLNTLELKGWLGSWSEVAAPWRLDFLPSQDSTFHIFHAGGGYLRIAGDPTPRRIEDGDLLVFPHGHAHTISDGLASPQTLPYQALAYHAHGECRILPFEGEGPTTVLLCGAFHFENAGHFPLLQFLPEVIHIPGKQGRLTPGLARLMELTLSEAADPQIGSDAVLRRLCELLFLQIIRVWIDQQSTTSSGWLTALRDQSISAALSLMHQSPERNWKVEELAEAVALSRSAFFSRFTHLVGEPPLKYLTRWRMSRARQLLKQGIAVEQIADHLGYTSEVAFRKAFKREIGIPPAEYRKLG